ncbi:FAD-dependent monooxygenase [Roseomonas harenae]|uniref:FAD-dependent monooxygenase n=1 Tax=Muricoccus harenae TaxID=2692566 RepID=UPI0013317538|nr:FAD-dependent monooxygenase [Roseomonas harenae]
MVADMTALVVGAGPTGLLLGSELRRRGVNCRIIDAHPTSLPWDRATVVHPRSLELFESLGIAAPLLAAGVKQRVARLYSAGSILGEIDLADCGSRYGFNIGLSEEVTESILTEYLHRQGGEIMRSCRLIDLQQQEDGVLVTIERSGAREQLSAQWVVGCDGNRSTVRTLGGIELSGHDIIKPWAVFDATLLGWPESYEANYCYLDELPVILTALPKQRWRVYLRPSAPDSDLVTDALSTLGRYLPKVSFDDIANPTRFHCHTKVAERFRSGRILLAGDAAHVCSPAQGHGMNSGLQDAFNLAWKLALVCQGHCTPALLDSYEAERRPVAEMITASGDAVELAQTMTDPAERHARDETLRALFADPTARHHEVMAEAELDVDYGASAIVMGDRHEALAPGQRVPDTVGVHRGDGEACLLHELANHAGHTALLIGGLAADSEALARLAEAIRARSHAPLIDAVVVLTARSDGQSPHTRLAIAAAEQLGVGEITLLVVRPDGYVGLRTDRDHTEALSAYLALLGVPPGSMTPCAPD